MRAAPTFRFALIATSTCSALDQLGNVAAQGFGAHIEGASVDAAGNLYATHFRGSADDSWNGNLIGRNVIGRVSAATGESAAFFEGEPNAKFNGMRWEAGWQGLFLADVGQSKVVHVDVATMTGTDYCGGAGSAMDGTGAPNDMALSKSGLLFLSGQQWETSTGGLWLCRPDGAGKGQLVQLEADMQRTNGIALSPDDRTLYLTEAKGSPVDWDASPDGQRIWRYTVSSDGSISDKTEFFNFASDMPTPEADIDSDGMRTDEAGNLYVVRNGKGKVVVISPAGELLAELQLNSIVHTTNLAFGGPDGKTIYAVGRCGDAGYGSGDGCFEAVAAGHRGREWTWLHGSDGATTVPPAMTVTTSTTSPVSGSCAAEWEQCGGNSWTGPTCCEQGLVCRARGEWYSQCMRNGALVQKSHQQSIRMHATKMHDRFLKPRRPLASAPVLLQSSGMLQRPSDALSSEPTAYAVASSQDEL